MTITARRRCRNLYHPPLADRLRPASAACTCRSCGTQVSIRSDQAYREVRRQAGLEEGLDQA